MRRIDLPSGILERYDQIEIAFQRCYPAMLRAVLEQQHSRQRTTRSLLAVGAPPLGFRDQPRGLQREPRDRVTELVVMPPHKLLVEMLHRKIVITFPVKLVHPLQFTHRRPPRRYFADAPIA